MRTIAVWTLLISATLIVSGQASSGAEAPRDLVARVVRLDHAVDSMSLKQRPVTQTALDSLRSELSEIKRLIGDLSRELNAAQGRDSLLQLLCDEIDLLKLDNQLLQAKLDGSGQAVASTDDEGFVTHGAGTPENPVVAGNTPETASAVNSEENLSVSGYVDAAGTFDNNSHNTDLNLSQVQLDLEKGVSERASFRADVAVISDGFDGYKMELEQGFVRLRASSSPAWQLYFGRFNSPIGIERFDPDVTWLYTRGFLFDYALPTNLTGIMSTLQLNRNFDLALMAVNGWNINADNNTGKSFGSRLGFSLGSGFKSGFSVLSGPELDDNNSSVRTIYDLDATVGRAEGWSLSLELHQGRETHMAETDATASWSGVMLASHLSLGGPFSTTARADYFNDRDGARTGVAQELKGLAVAPAMSIVDGLDMVLELRQNWSNRGGLDANDPEVKSAFSSALEFVYSF